MTAPSMSTLRPDNPLVRTERAPFGTEGENPPPTHIRDRLAIVAELAGAAARAHLGEPMSVSFTGQDCTIVLDTAGVLGWSRLLPGRPEVRTYPDSPFILVAGSVRGVRIELHNGAAPPVPTPRRRTPRAEGPA